MWLRRSKSRIRFHNASPQNLLAVPSKIYRLSWRCEVVFHFRQTDHRPRTLLVRKKNTRSQLLQTQIKNGGKTSFYSGGYDGAEKSYLSEYWACESRKILRSAERFFSLKLSKVEFDQRFRAANKQLEE